MQRFSRFIMAPLVGALFAACAVPARADAITDWNQRSAQVIAEARMGTPPAVRVMALVQTAAYEAARDAARSPDPSAQAIDVAIAAAHRSAFLQLLPAQRATIDTAFQAALAQIPDDALLSQQLAVGEKAAQRVLAERADDMPRTPDTYRPHASPGAYVPTAIPAVAQWPQRKPWLLKRTDQFRPAPPPALTSERWASDFNEVKALGRRDSPQRSAEQTEIGRFWDYSLPAVYHGVVRSVALQPGRDVLANARLFATASQAMDDALMAVFDAKYQYNWWRPITAIRNGDVDGHGGTERDAGWTPLIDTPMHPEYPCAHCTLAAAVGAVLHAQAGPAPLPVLSTTSPTAKDAMRSWNSVEAFTQEVAQARIVAGVHYRFSTEAGQVLGQRVGEWAASHAETAGP
ncbi:vanadium-dependent haloperoxidase [Ideonella sp. YS5]|uniref:vanadium-dependent haloperoxidase n=1 Tax=Ideonella sp. YS5 TaxID=3453714 RepID=UPI003EEB84F3